MYHRLLWISVLVFPAAADAQQPNNTIVPSVEEVAGDLLSGADDAVRRALTDITIHRLPMVEQVRPFLTGEHASIAIPAYFAAGGDAGDLLALKAEPDDPVRVAMTLLHSRDHRQAAIEDLVRLVVAGDLTAQEVFCDLGGDAAQDAVALLLDAFSKPLPDESLLDDPFRDHSAVSALFPVSISLRERHWPAVVRMSHHVEPEIRFLAAHWIVTGGFDDVAADEVRMLCNHADRALRTAASALLLRRLPDDAQAEQLLRTGLDHAESRVYHPAIVGITAMANETRFKAFIFPLLLREEHGLRELALEACYKCEHPIEDDLLTFVEQHVEKIPPETLVESVRHCRYSEAESKSNTRFKPVLLQLLMHQEPKVRQFAISQFSQFPPTADLVTQVIAALDGTSPTVSEEALITLSKWNVVSEQREAVVARITPLLSEEAPAWAKGFRRVIAVLHWKYGIDRPRVLQLAEQLLSSDVHEDVGEGIEIAGALGAESTSLAPKLFDSAKRSQLYRLHLMHHRVSLRPAFLGFVLDQMKSPNAQDRGVALDLLRYFSDGETKHVNRCLELLDDDAKYRVRNLFSGESLSKSVCSTAAVTTAHLARDYPSIAERLRDDPVAIARLQPLLSNELMKWITHPRPTLMQMIEQQAPADYWTIEERLGEVWTSDRPELTHEGFFPLLWRFMELTEQGMPALYEPYMFLGLPLYSDIDHMPASSESLVPLLERWVSEMPLLNRDERCAAAEFLLELRPDHRAAARYIEMCRRSFIVGY